MRKFILSLCFGLMFFGNQLHSQLVVSFSNVEVDPGTSTATVDVTVSGFTNVLSAQFSVNYDSLVIGYNSVTNLNLPGLLQGNFSGPNGAGVKNGQMTFSWSEPSLENPVSLPNGTRIFSIVFNVLGAQCTKSDVTMTNMPLSIEFVNGSFMQITNISSVKGSVSVKCDGGGNPTVDPCPDAVCANPAFLAFTGDTVKADKGSKICVPFRVRNFVNIQGGAGTFSWDTTQLKYEDVKGNPFNGFLYNKNRVNEGILVYLFDNATPDQPKNLPNGTILFELCFEVLAERGTKPRICMGKVTPPEMDWSAELNGNIISAPFCVKAGTVCVEKIDEAPPVKLTVSTAQGNKGTNICLDVRVENFTNIRNMQYSMTWDPNVLRYTSTGMYDLKALDASDFQQPMPQPVLNLTWNTGDNSVVSLPNGHKIYQVCFDLIGECGQNSVVTIGNVPLVIEINGDYNNNPDYQFQSTIVPGGITIVCTGVTCEIVSKTNVTCNGGADGSIVSNVAVPSGTTGCMCVWKNNAGTILKTSANLNDCNLVNQPAGQYTLEVICNGNVECSKVNEIIGQPAVISIPNTGVTNVMCGVNGAINVAGITGGNPPYLNYNWNPTQPNVPNISNLPLGIYQLTVTDSRGCTGTQSFQVNSSVSALTVTLTQTPVKCNGGEDGQIDVSVTGGCPPYTSNWGIVNPEGVRAGVYTVTVSDSSVPALTSTATVTVTEPAVLSLTSTATATTGGLNNGTITLTTVGGTAPYTYRWQSNATQVPDNTTNPTNLAVGIYNVTVTDINGCTQVASNINVTSGGVPAEVLFDNVRVSTNFGGFSVACNSDCTAIVQGNISQGALPINVLLKSGAATVKTITVNTLGNFQITGICVGNYVVEFVNSVGVKTSSTLSVTAPTRLQAQRIITCTETTSETGAIELNLNNTGVSPYTFVWSSLPDQTAKIENLGVGTYSATVTDANGCILVVSNIDVRPCPKGDDCGKGSIVLTPDGNNQNDYFVIDCAEELGGTLSVFDRWGRLVFNQSPYDNNWSGLNNNGDILPEGAYVWIYEVNYGQGVRDTFNGTVTLLR